MSLGFVKREIPVTRCVSMTGPESACKVKDAIDVNESENVLQPHSRLSVFIWRGVVYLVAFVLPFVTLGVSVVNVSLKGYNFVPGVLVVLVLIISIFQWLRNMFSMNLFVRGRRRKVRFYAIGLYIMSAFYYLAGSFAILRQNWVIQFVASLLGSVTAWTGFIALFNGTFDPPTRQQVIALPQIILLALLWEARSVLTNIVLIQEGED